MRCLETPLLMVAKVMDCTMTAELAGSQQDTRIHDELSRVLASRSFHASERLRRLLAHLVEQTLDGKQRMLTQRHLAEDVFGRGNGFDPENDAIVRVEMSKLRRALADYYAQDNQEPPVAISLPKGGYTPKFITGTDVVAPVTVVMPPLQNTDVERPVLAIVPFSGCNAEADSNSLTLNLMRELNVTLAQIPYLKITSKYHLDDAPRSLDKLHAHGVRFVLDGSVQWFESRLRVTSELHDLRCNEQIWTERFDYTVTPDQALTLRDQMVRTIAAHTADLYSGAINNQLTRELDPDKVDGFSAYETMLLFYRFLNQHSDASYLAARRAVEFAATAEQDNPLLLAMLADVRRTGYSLGYTEEPDPLTEVLELARRAVNLSPNSATCRLSLCYALLQARDKQALLEVIKPLLHEGLASPSHAGDAAIALAFAGEWQRGCDLIRQIIKPLAATPHIFDYPSFLYAYRQGDYKSAWDVATRFHALPFFWQSILRVAVLGKLGRIDAAKTHKDELLRLRPAFCTHGRRYLSCFLMEDSLVDDLVDGLRKAGLDVN